MNIKLLLLITIGTNALLVGDDSTVFQLKNGTLIQGVNHIEPQPNGIKIFHVDGIKFARIDELTEDQISRYGINPDVAAEFDKKEREARIKNSNDEKARQEEKDRQRQEAKEREAIQTFANSKGIDARGKILQVLHDDNARRVTR
jgi:hypothetical protein